MRSHQGTKPLLLSGAKEWPPGQTELVCGFHFSLWTRGAGCEGGQLCTPKGALFKGPQALSSEISGGLVFSLPSFYSVIQRGQIWRPAGPQPCLAPPRMSGLQWKISCVVLLLAALEESGAWHRPTPQTLCRLEA